MIEVKEAKEQDIPAIIELGRYSASLGGSSTEVCDGDAQTLLARMMQDDSAEVLVACDGGDVVGVIGYVVGGVYYNTKVRSCNKLFWIVKPSHQKTGVGAKLIDAMEDDAARKGCVICVVSLRADNPTKTALPEYTPFEVHYKKELS